MKLSFVKWVAPAGLALVLSAGCAERAAEPQGKLALDVAPITLPGVGAACYDIVVTHEVPEVGTEVVWSATNICSDANIADNGATSSYGNGGPGGIAYFGSCVDDNAGGPTTNNVTISLTAVFDENSNLMPGWVQPPDFETDVDCNESADTRVNASFVVLQQAVQGFLDLKVALDQIACSAKIDCVSGLYYPPSTSEITSPSGDAVVIALSCNATDGSFTNLYMDDITIVCDGNTAFEVDPTLGPGNTSQGNGYFVTDTMVSEGVYDDEVTSYWVTTIGFDPWDGPNNCFIQSVRMTASSSASGAFSHFSDYQSYPVITLDSPIPIYDSENGFGCQNPLNGDSSLLITDYAEGSSLELGQPNEFDACLWQGGSNGVDTERCSEW